MKDELKLELNKPLNRKFVSERTQSGTTLSYIEGHHVIREANRIFGFDGWQLSVESFEVVSSEEYKKKAYNKSDPPIPMHRICVCARVTIQALNISRTDVGYGNGSAKTLADAHESAGKEAVTDAMKRAFRTFGDQFGNALYDKTQAHVADVGYDGDAVSDMQKAKNKAALQAIWKKMSPGQQKEYRKELDSNIERVT